VSPGPERGVGAAAVDVVAVGVRPVALVAVGRGEHGRERIARLKVYTRQRDRLRHLPGLRSDRRVPAKRLLDGGADEAAVGTHTRERLGMSEERPDADPE